MLPLNGLISYLKCFAYFFSYLGWRQIYDTTMLTMPSSKQSNRFHPLIHKKGFLSKKPPTTLKMRTRNCFFLQCEIILGKLAYVFPALKNCRKDLCCCVHKHKTFRFPSLLSFPKVHIECKWPLFGISELVLWLRQQKEQSTLDIT